MPGLSGAKDFGALAQRLKDAGEGGLRRKLYKAISDASQPLERQLKDAERLNRYMPRRYAEAVVADLQVGTYKRANPPQITVRAQSQPPKERKVIQLDDGSLRHPLFGDREHWYLQLRGLRPGFFSDAVDETGRQVLDAMGAAVDEISQQIMGG